MKKLIVQKYGGSSLKDKDAILNVAKRIIKSAQDNKIIAVVSAQGDSTDYLINKANEISVNANKRELDMLLSVGEQLSAALLSMAINDLGHNAISLNASQIGIFTTDTHSDAIITNIEKDRINAELDNGNIIIATGFQGINSKNDITTLGRGGSDTTAVAIAVALNAEKCEIYTDVNGVYTADPRIIKNAKKLDEIDFEDMLELATFGAQVLHNRSVELAKKYNVNLYVKSSIEEGDGTRIVADAKKEIAGIAIDKNITSIVGFGIDNKIIKINEIANKYNVQMIIKSKINLSIITQDSDTHKLANELHLALIG